MANKTQETFYVGIREPTTFRKDLLGCSKGILTSLKRFESFKDLRNEKIKHVLDLKRVVKEINIIVSKLKSSLPKTSLRNLPVEKKEIIEEATKKINKVSRTKVKKPQDDLDKLESEIGDIESKLEELA